MVAVTRMATQRPGCKQGLHLLTGPGAEAPSGSDCSLGLAGVGWASPGVAACWVLDQLTCQHPTAPFGPSSCSGLAPLSAQKL